MTNLPATFEDSHARVCKLVKDFAEREAYYLDADYQEAEARADFIDKFWVALGWDVRHDHQKNPYEQEVKVERGVMVGLAQKKADYAFFLGNYRDPRFFCEAKKPSVRIREDRDAHFQTHRYGWNGQTPLSVLMDSQTLVIVDFRS
jgi:adenine-specific DNA-methyltransferase